MFLSSVKFQDGIFLTVHKYKAFCVSFKTLRDGVASVLVVRDFNSGILSFIADFYFFVSGPFRGPS